MLEAPPQIVSIVPAREKAPATELKVLDSYVEHIRLWSTQSVQAGAIPFDGVVVEVSPWVSRALLRFANAPTANREALESLVAEAVAVIAKCKTDATAVVNPIDLNQIYAHQAESMLDVAVGTVVLERLAKKSSEMIAAGRNDDLRELTALQRQVGRNVRLTRGLLNESENARVSEFVTVFGGESEPRDEPIARHQARLTPQPRAKLARPQHTPEVPTVVYREARASGRHTSSYTFWVVVLAVAAGLVAVGVVRLGPADAVVGDVSESLKASMADIRGVVEVQDRNPYVLLTVHDSFWQASSPSRQRDWIEDASREAERHGYSGMMIRSTGGVPLAEWVRDRGIKFPESE